MSEPQMPPNAAAPGNGPGEAAATSGEAAATSGEAAATGEELRRLRRQAAAGDPEGLRRLVEWTGRQETETMALRRRLRKQAHDHSTLFEIVSQTSARSLDLEAMQTYLLRTISGHFATPKLLILRRAHEGESELRPMAQQGFRYEQLRLPVTSPLCAEALRRRFCFLLRDLSGTSASLSEVLALRALGVELAVPLVQEVEAPAATLEGFLLLGARLPPRPYEEPDLEFLHVLGTMLAICLRNESLYRRSIVDDLTGVYSRGYFDAQLAQEVSRVVTYGHPSLGLVMLDIDQFKQCNDRYGHPTGDRVLRSLAQVLVRQVRELDLVARYGGDEFAIVLMEIDRARMLEIATRLCQAVEEMTVHSVDGVPLRVTASLGAASFPDDAGDRAELVQRADQALYQAKEEGRNRVVLALPRPGAAKASPARRARARAPERRGTPKH